MVGPSDEEKVNMVDVGVSLIESVWYVGMPFISACLLFERFQMIIR